MPLELGNLQFKAGGTLGEVLGRRGFDKLGKEAWTDAVRETAATLQLAFSADYVVLGGGNAKKLKGALPGVRLGHNLTAFRGGVRVWNIEHVPTLSAAGEEAAPARDAHRVAGAVKVCSARVDECGETPPLRRKFL